MLENTPPLITQEETPAFTGSLEHSSSQDLYQPSQRVPDQSSQLASPHKTLSPVPAQHDGQFASQPLTNSQSSEGDLYKRIFGEEDEVESNNTNSTPKSNLR